MQDRLNEQGRNTIQGLRNTVRVLWTKCCEEDGIPPDSSFVVFSDGNKYIPFYESALKQLWEAEAAYAAGGYVGLVMDERGKATRVRPA